VYIDGGFTAISKQSCPQAIGLLSSRFRLDNIYKSCKLRASSAFWFSGIIRPSGIHTQKLRFLELDVVPGSIPGKARFLASCCTFLCSNSFDIDVVMLF
jgi:hypothetical protein